MLPLGAQDVFSVQNGCMINFKTDLSDKLNPENIEKLGLNLPIYEQTWESIIGSCFENCTAILQVTIIYKIFFPS